MLLLTSLKNIQVHAHSSSIYGYFSSQFHLVHLMGRNENENEPSRRWISRYLQRPTKKGCPLMSAYRVDIVGNM
jgi:hypothetical protein